MNYKKLGNTDLKVSTICLGTMTWGEQNTQNEGFEQMDYALDQGVNFWDTAEIYSVPPRQETFGHTETIIGNWFEKTKKRDKVILASKVCGPMREYVRGGGNQFGEKNITEALEGSLKRLQVDYIDSLIIHNPPIEFLDGNNNPHYEILERLIDEGKINAYGASLDTYKDMKLFMETTNCGVIEAFFNTFRKVLKKVFNE